MLNSLYIKNFRNLEELTIESLGRVNLITGKNNTGKSSVLEAVALWVADGNIPLLLDIIRNRGDWVQANDIQTNVEDAHLKMLSSIFTNKQVAFDDENAVKIGSSPKDTLTLKFTKSTNRFISGANVPDEINFEAFKENQLLYGFPLTQDIKQISFRTEELSHLQFVAARHLNRLDSGHLFDNIILTEKEKYIIDALRIIEPKTQRIAFVQENGHRKAVIKLSDNPQVLPLQSMGDGINRIFTIILALVNCEKGYLLIDEFENGLYHNIQQELWGIILHLAEELDIQVFATTHSWDCVEAFEEVMNSEESSSDGKLIRLEHKNGKIRPVEFRKSQLESATKYGIEIR